MDLVTRYAVHNPTVAFVCKKAGSATPDISTPSGSTVPQTIRLLYGHAVARDLVRVDAHGHEKSGKKRKRRRQDGEEYDMSSGDEAGEPVWTAEAHVTNANYHAKKTTFLLFINRKSLPPYLPARS